MKRLVRFQLAIFIFSMAAWASRERRFTVVLVDTSLTVTNYQSYEDAYKQVLATLNPGDGIVVILVKGRVLNPQKTNDASLKTNRERTNNSPSKQQRKELVSDTQLREIANQEVRSCTIDRPRFDCDDDLASANAALSIALKTALEQPRSDHTALLATLDEAAKYFKSARQQERVLILLSDMLEDSPEARFELADPDERFTQQYIAKRKKENTLPDLARVKVFVAGAEAKNEEKLRKVEIFWIQYLSAAKAEIGHENYGNRLIGFN